MGGEDEIMAGWNPSENFPALKREPWYIRIFPEWMVENPWEAFIGLLGSVSAIPLMLGHRPVSIERLLPQTLQIAWACMLFLGCVLVLLGLGTRKVLIERLGLQIFGPSTIVYGTAILVVGGWAGLGAFFPYCLFSIVSYLQAYKLRRTFLSGAQYIDRASKGEEADQ
jgi:hypothetical protein